MNFEMNLLMCDNSFKMDMGQTTTLKGKDGLSAYQIAQQQGFEGTEQEWLDSLKGEDGQSYDDTELASRVTALENTIGTLNDSLEEVLTGNGN